MDQGAFQSSPCRISGLHHKIEAHRADIPFKVTDRRQNPLLCQGPTPYPTSIAIKVFIKKMFHVGQPIESFRGILWTHYNQLISISRWLGLAWFLRIY